MDDWLRNDDKLTARLKVKLFELCANFCGVALSTTIKRLDNYCTSVLLLYGL